VRDDHDVADRLARHLRRSTGSDSLSGDDLWRACGSLADAGLLTTDEELLGLRQVGPFRIASTAYSGAVTDLIEVTLPSVIAGWITGSPAAGTIAGITGTLCKTFVEVIRRGVVLGRSREDQVRWTVLVAMHEMQGSGEPAHVSPLTARLAPVVLDGRPITSDEVTAALMWLANDDGVRGPDKPPLISKRDDGSYVSLV
jgi:hypothetical protein